MITPTNVANAALEEGLFTAEQLKKYTFQGVRRQCEQWMKTLDDYGLGIWGQLPLVDTESGERAWEQREYMDIDGYAWNYLLRDDVIVKNTVLRERWRTEALKRWSAKQFDAAIERLREQREQGEDAA